MRYIFVVLIVLNIFSWSVVLGFNQDKLEVCFFDIGHGDSIFIEGENIQILIDGGVSDLILEKLSSKMSFFDNTIDLIVLTHPHQDHLYGLLKVLENYDVENIVWTGIEYESKSFEKWKELIGEEGSKIFIAKKGLRIKYSDNGYLETLYPFDSLEGEIFKDINDGSIVFKLVDGDESMLLTGDISVKVEAELLEDDIDLRADILKVAHQGSKTSSLPEFIEEVSPSLAVISVGKDNIYNHPSDEVLARFEREEIPIKRTDLDGDICLIKTEDWAIKEN